MLKVFCRLNLPVVMQSADWDRLILRFLKNSKPPDELGSWTERTDIHTDTQRDLMSFTLHHIHHVDVLEVCCVLLKCVVFH